ncbi:MAG: type II toxin-antitoxin system RelE/ParE family toxin, partial [Candidatus Binatia bacterium]
ADLRAMPEEVKDRVGYALWRAQLGEKAESAKALKGFGDAGVLEIVEDFDRATYRAVYTVRFAQAVYVLHVFQKKSRKGGKTPPADIALIERRLRWAEQDVKARGEER